MIVYIHRLRPEFTPQTLSFGYEHCWKELVCDIPKPWVVRSYAVTVEDVYNHWDVDSQKSTECHLHQTFTVSQLWGHSSKTDLYLPSTTYYWAREPGNHPIETPHKMWNRDPRGNLNSCSRVSSLADLWHGNDRRKGRERI